MPKLLLGALLLTLAACSEPIDPDTPGSIKVTVTTTGEVIDPDGYSVLLGFPYPHVASSGSVVVGDLTPEVTFELRLGDIAPNCSYTSAGVDTVTVRPGRQESVAFALACVGPANVDIAFSASVTGQPADIYRVDLNGLDFRNVTTSPTDEFLPIWKRDGTKIAFMGTDETFHRSLFVMDPDGANRTDLGIDFIPFAWSPDGTRLVGNAGDASNLYLVNSDGTGVTNLTNRVCIPGAECGTVYPASWSPDGSHIVYQLNRGFAASLSTCNVIDVNGTGATEIKDDCINPSWSPDGSHIAYSGIGTRSDNLRGHLFLMTPDGTTTLDLSLVEPAPPQQGGGEDFDGSPSWSPDGTQLAFLSRRDIPEAPLGTRPAIFVMNADGTNVHPVRVDAAGFEEILGPAWQPVAPIP